MNTHIFYTNSTQDIVLRGMYAVRSVEVSQGKVKQGDFRMRFFQLQYQKLSRGSTVRDIHRRILGDLTESMLDLTY